MNLRLIIILLLFNTTLALAAPVKFSLSYYHDLTGHHQKNYSPDKLKFTPFDANHPLPALDNRGTYLFKLTINEPMPAGGLITHIRNEHLDTIALYQLQADTLALVDYAGNSFYKSRSRLGPPTFELRGPATEYYLKVTFNHNVSFPVFVFTVPGYARFNLILFFEIGLYHGLVMVVFLINLFLFFVFKDKRFIYYNGFLFFLVLSFLYSNSHFSLFTTSIFLLNNGDLLLHLGMVICGAMFAIAFLEIENTYPWLKWANITFVIIIAATFFINAWHPSFCVFLTGEIAVFASLTMYWVISLYRLKKQIFSKYFALAYGVLLFFTINFYILHLFGISWFDFFVGQLEGANVIEMLTLSVALVFSVDRLRQQNQHYRAEIDRYMHNEMDLQNQSAEKTGQIFSVVKTKYHLTEREAEVLKGITEGLTNQEIGEQLFLSVNTIKFHTRNIFEKMEISNRAQAVSRLHETG